MARERTVEVKLRAVAAMAESLADDVRDGKLWEGDLDRRVAEIVAAAAAATEAAREVGRR